MAEPINRSIARAVQIGVKSRFVGYGDGAACTVEDLVLQHLSQREEGSWAGWHCEGSPVRGLWALLMWDVLFLDVPEVFQVKSRPDRLGENRNSLHVFFFLRRAAPVFGVSFGIVCKIGRARREGSTVRRVGRHDNKDRGRAAAAAARVLCPHHFLAYCHSSNKDTETKKPRMTRTPARLSTRFHRADRHRTRTPLWTWITALFSTSTAVRKWTRASRRSGLLRRPS